MGVSYQNGHLRPTFGARMSLAIITENGEGGDLDLRPSDGLRNATEVHRTAATNNRSSSSHQLWNYHLHYKSDRREINQLLNRYHPRAQRPSSMLPTEFVMSLFDERARENLHRGQNLLGWNSVNYSLQQDRWRATRQKQKRIRRRQL